MNIIELLKRNYCLINGKKAVKGINLEWWSSSINLGDYLALVVCNWMIKDIKEIKKNNKIIHLMTIGSVIGMRAFDAVIWGSGIHSYGTLNALIMHKSFVRYDVRAVRGPITKWLLEGAGYDCLNTVLGDPAILMPLIYKPDVKEKEYDVSIIPHISLKKKYSKDNNYHVIDIQTTEYKYFIDEIVKSKKIISSSLHGIILAETYKVPAVFLGTGMEAQFLKYYDWYYSTGRYSVKIARTLQEAIGMEPMELPDLNNLLKGLIDSFPYDLFTEV